MALNDTADFQRKIHDFNIDVTRHLEMMAAAYTKETNIPPEECELVVETLPDKVIYRLQRRRNRLDCPEYETRQESRMSETERGHYIRMISMYKSTAVSGVLSALAFATIAIGTIIYMVIK